MGEKPIGEGFNIQFFDTTRVRNSVNASGMAVKSEVDYESTDYRR